MSAEATNYAAVARLPESELSAPRPIVFGSLIRTLNHVHAMDHVWRCHREGRGHGLTTRNPAPEAALQEVVHFTFIGGGAGGMSRGDILLHVVNHGTYHRGHVAAMMYQSDVPPPTTDLPVFLRS